MGPVLEVRDLRKVHGAHAALDGVDLTVGEGEVFGLLGPNGAGKTTLMKAVLGLVRPSGGNIHLFGRPFERRSLAGVGALVETPGLWPRLDAVEHLEIHARLRGVPVARIGAVLELVGLDGVRKRQVARYSLGMRWRLGIAVALLARPRLVLLDEPTNGLDPVGVREIRSIIRDLGADGTTVLVSSHQLTEIAQVCDRIGVLVAGRTRYEGTVEGLAEGGDLESGFFRVLDECGSTVR
jgi:ABC-2 type transport system ATP-binding protein